MMSFLKIVRFEMNRFSKIYAVLIAVTIILQITGAIISAKKYLNFAHEVMYEQSMSVIGFVENYGSISLYTLTQSMWFFGPIALAIVTLLLYVFLIWYRDWYGKNPFIYRLLMLPTSRMNIYFAKSTVIFLMVLGLIAIQLILLPIENSLLKWIVPLDFRADMTVLEAVYAFDYLTVLIPRTFFDFIVHYSIGFLVVYLIFTAILMERCYRWKGIIFGLLYSALAIIIFLAPIIVTIRLEKMYLYPLELLFLQIVLGILVLGVTFWVNHYLLKHKVTV